MCLADETPIRRILSLGLAIAKTLFMCAKGATQALLTRQEVCHLFTNEKQNLLLFLNTAGLRE